jgi:isocitrate dehydrogenase
MIPEFSWRSKNGILRKKLETKYSKVLGSAVNPVLREGNSLTVELQKKVQKTRVKVNPHLYGEHGQFGISRSNPTPSIPTQTSWARRWYNYCIKGKIPLEVGEIIDSSVIHFAVT